jgi:hypothetical protein
MRPTIAFYLLTMANTAVTLPHELVKRQCSTTWSYQYEELAAPGNYKAFDLGGCAAQLSFNKDQYISVQWLFESTYADGSRLEHKPFRNFNSFGVSDPFYPYLGNNFVTRYPGNSAFTAVHEFTNVCSNGQAPVSWRFYTAGSSCYTTDQITVVGGVARPPKVSGVSLRRANDAGDFQVSWTAAEFGVAAYSVIVEYPTGRDEIGNPYLNVRGARVKVGVFQSNAIQRC